MERVDFISDRMLYSVVIVGKPPSENGDAAMSISPIDLPVNLPQEITGVRRVERDSETTGFGQKEKSDHEFHKNHAQHDDPQDTVEVSDEYLASSNGGESDTDSEELEITDVRHPEQSLDIQA